MGARKRFDQAPVVSVCVTTFNSGPFAERAVASALAQTYSPLEVVVVDDCSADGTAQRLRTTFGDAIQVYANGRSSGQARTVNATVAKASGELIKFLDHDDYLHPECVAELVSAAAGDPQVALAFCRRDLEVAPDADLGPDWRSALRDLHHGFTALQPRNDGSAILRELFGGGLRSNWIGGPSGVMVRRSTFLAAGGMNPRERQFVDFDLWLRILARGDAVFVDRELATYRASTESVSGRNAAARRGWLDRLWTVETLLRDPAMADWKPVLLEIRAAERKAGWRTAVRGGLRLSERAGNPRDWLEYMAGRVTPGALEPVAGGRLPAVVARL